MQALASMSKRVYLLKNPYQTTQEEHTPVSLRIQASNATVKALHTRLQDAYRRDDVRLVRRISVLLALLTQTASVPALCERWGLRVCYEITVSLRLAWKNDVIPLR